MFGRRKGGEKGESRANKLRDEAEPNTLSWTADQNPDDEDFVEEDDLEDEEEIEAEFDEDEEDEGDQGDEQDEGAGPSLAEREAALRKELDRQAEEFGLTNLDPTTAFGPNGQEVQAIIDSLEDLDIDAGERLADAWLAIDPADRDLVERDIRRRHRDGSHSYELTAAEDAVSGWLSRELAANDEDADLWRLVADAATAACFALILDQDLDVVDYETLYGPWSETMEAEEPEQVPAPKGKAAATSQARPGKPAPQAKVGKPGPSGKPATAAKPSATGKAGASAKGTPAAKTVSTGKSTTTTRKAGAGDKEEEAELDEELYGPNTAEVQEVLGLLANMTIDETLELAAFWKEQPRSDLHQAHQAAKDLAREDETWKEQVQRAQADVSAWVNRMPQVPLGRHRSGLSVTEARGRALPAAVDAVTALVLADLLEPEDAETLYAPWLEAVGVPALPKYEAEEDDEGE